MPKTCKQFCEAYKKKSLKLMKRFDAIDEKTMKTMTPADQKKFKARQTKRKKAALKQIDRDCKKQFCNKTCKNTILEAGRNKYPPLPKELTTDKELKALMIKIQKDTKRRLFGDKDNVLKDGFYEKLSQVKVNKIKEKGAISACVEKLFDDFI